MTVTLDSIPRLHPEAGVHRVGGKLLASTDDDVLHTFQDGSGTVSEVGERIVALIDGRKTVGEIVEILVGEFEVEPAVCRQNTLEFISVLVQKRLVTL